MITQNVPVTELINNHSSSTVPSFTQPYLLPCIHRLGSAEWLTRTVLNPIKHTLVVSITTQAATSYAINVIPAV